MSVIYMVLEGDSQTLPSVTEDPGPIIRIDSHQADVVHPAAPPVYTFPCFHPNYSSRLAVDAGRPADTDIPNGYCSRHFDQPSILNPWLAIITRRIGH